MTRGLNVCQLSTDFKMCSRRRVDVRSCAVLVGDKFEFGVSALMLNCVELGTCMCQS